MQREIAERLRDIAPPGSFAVQRSAPAEALRIDVTGAGPLDLPLSPRTVARLRAVATRSRYGLRDRTLYDVSVRNSWEIARRRIRIDQHRWNATLIPLLHEIRAGLGLAEGVVLKAELHNMLLYERGQFFVPHQDSEKSDGMIGMGNWGNTLERWYHRAAIVIWPRERTFVIRARAAASWALQEVVRTLRRGKQPDARRKVESLLPFWDHTARVASEPLMHDALRVAAGIADATLASRLLSPLPLPSSRHCSGRRRNATPTSVSRFFPFTSSAPNRSRHG